MFAIVIGGVELHEGDDDILLNIESALRSNMEDEATKSTDQSIIKIAMKDYMYRRFSSALPARCEEVLSKKCTCLGGVTMYGDIPLCNEVCKNIITRVCH